MSAQKYRMKSLAGPFRPGTIVTEEQANAAGGDLQFWKSHGAVEGVTDEEAAAEDAPMTDGALKETIERRIREETVKRGALPPGEAAKIASDVVADNKQRFERRETANPARRTSTATAKPAPPPAPLKP